MKEVKFDWWNTKLLMVWCQWVFFLVFFSTLSNNALMNFDVNPLKTNIMMTIVIDINTIWNMWPRSSDLVPLKYNQIFFKTCVNSTVPYYFNSSTFYDFHYTTPIQIPWPAESPKHHHLQTFQPGTHFTIMLLSVSMTTIRIVNHFNRIFVNVFSDPGHACACV